MTQNNNSTEVAVAKTPYEKLVGENHENERVSFVWDQIPEELI